MNRVQFVRVRVLCELWLVQPRLGLLFTQALASASTFAPERRPAAPSLRFALLRRLAAQGSPSLANPFGGEMVHRTISFLRLTRRHHPASLVQYAG